MMDGELRENMGRKLERAGGAERGGLEVNRGSELKSRDTLLCVKISGEILLGCHHSGLMWVKNTVLKMKR